MTTYSAYSRVSDKFDTLEGAVDALTKFPWTAGREVTAVSVLTGEDLNGAHGQLVGGSPTNVISTTQAYVVGVTHRVQDKALTIEYIIEFGEEYGETGEDSDGLEPRDEEASQELDRSPEQGGEGDGDVPPAGDADYSDEYYEHN